MNNKLISDFHKNTESISLLARINLPSHYHIQGQALYAHLNILNSILNNNKTSAKKAFKSGITKSNIFY